MQSINFTSGGGFGNYPLSNGFAVESEAIKCLYVIKNCGFRYRQAEIARIGAVERLERTAGLAWVARWLRKAQVTKHFGVDPRFWFPSCVFLESPS